MKRGKRPLESSARPTPHTAGAAWRDVTQGQHRLAADRRPLEWSVKGGMAALPGAARKKLPGFEESRILGVTDAGDGCSWPANAAIGLQERQPAARYSGFRSMTRFEVANPRTTQAFI